MEIHESAMPLIDEHSFIAISIKHLVDENPLLLCLVAWNCWINPMALDSKRTLKCSPTINLVTFHCVFSTSKKYFHKSLSRLSIKVVKFKVDKWTHKIIIGLSCFSFNFIVKSKMYLETFEKVMIWNCKEIENIE